MSILKTIRAQLGLSNTATQNFTLDASAADGTMKLARGNAGSTTQDILTVDANGKVSFPQQVQAWQDVKTTPGRALATNYTNTTGVPIQVVVGVAASVAPCTAQATVGGVVLTGSYSPNAGFNAAITFTVPAGAVYSVIGLGGSGFSVANWTELR